MVLTLPLNVGVPRLCVGVSFSFVRCPVLNGGSGVLCVVPVFGLGLASSSCPRFPFVLPPLFFRLCVVVFVVGGRSAVVCGVWCVELCPTLLFSSLTVFAVTALLV